jgi:hypothetical protein
MNNIPKWLNKIQDPMVNTSDDVERMKYIKNQPNEIKSSDDYMYDYSEANNTFRFKDVIDTSINILESSYFHDMWENDLTSHFYSKIFTSDDLDIRDDLMHVDDPHGRSIQPSPSTYFEYKLNLDYNDPLARDQWWRVHQTKVEYLMDRWLTADDIAEFNKVFNMSLLVYIGRLIVSDVQIKIPAQHQYILFRFKYDRRIYDAIRLNRPIEFRIYRFKTRVQHRDEIITSILENKYNWTIDRSNCKYPDILDDYDSDLLLMILSQKIATDPIVGDPNRMEINIGPELVILHVEKDENGYSFVDLNKMDQSVRDWLNFVGYADVTYIRPSNMFEYPKLVTKNPFDEDMSERPANSYNGIYDFIVLNDDLHKWKGKTSPVSGEDFLVLKKISPSKPTANPWFDDAFRPASFKVENAYATTYKLINAENSYWDKVETGEANRPWRLVETQKLDMDPVWQTVQVDILDVDGSKAPPQIYNEFYYDTQMDDPSPDCRVYYFTKLHHDNVELDPIILRAMQCARKYLFNPYNYIQPIIGNLPIGTEVTVKENSYYDTTYIVAEHNYPLKGSTLLIRKYAMSKKKMNEINFYYINDLYATYAIAAYRFFNIGDISYFNAKINGTATNYERFFNLSVQEVNNDNPFINTLEYEDSNFKYGTYLKDVFTDAESRICYTDETETVPVKWVLRDESRRVKSYEQPRDNPSNFVVLEDGTLTDELSPDEEVYYRPCISLDNNYNFQRWQQSDLDVDGKSTGIYVDLPEFMKPQYLTSWEDDRLIRLIAANPGYFMKYLTLLYPADGVYRAEKYYKLSQDNMPVFDPETWKYPLDYLTLKLKQFDDLYVDNFLNYLERQYDAPFKDWKIRLYKNSNLSEYKRYYTKNVFVYTDNINLQHGKNISEFNMFPGFHVKLKDIHVWRMYNILYDGNDVTVMNDGTVIPIKHIGARWKNQIEDTGDLFALDRNDERIWRVDVQNELGAWDIDVNDPEVEVRYGLRLWHLPEAVYYPHPSEYPNWEQIYPGMDIDKFGPYPTWTILTITECEVHYEFPTIRDTPMDELWQTPTEIELYDVPQFVVKFDNYTVKDSKDYRHEITYIPFVGGYEHDACEVDYIEKTDYVRYPYDRLIDELKAKNSQSLITPPTHNEYWKITEIRLTHTGTRYYEGQFVYVNVDNKIRPILVIDKVDQFGSIISFHLMKYHHEFKNINPSGNYKLIPDTTQRVDNKWRHGEIGLASGNTIEEVQLWWDNDSNKEFWDVAEVNIITELGREEYLPGISHNTECNNTFTLRKQWSYEYNKKFTLSDGKDVLIHPDENDRNELHLEDVNIWNIDKEKYEPFDIAGGQQLFTLTSIIPDINKSTYYTNKYSIDFFKAVLIQLNFSQVLYNISDISLTKLRGNVDIRNVLTVKTGYFDINATIDDMFGSIPIFYGIEPIGSVPTALFREAWKIPTADVFDYQDYTYHNRELKTVSGKVLYKCSIDIRHYDSPMSRVADSGQDTSMVRIIHVYNVIPVSYTLKYDRTLCEISPDEKLNNDTPENGYRDKDNPEYIPYDLISYTMYPPYFQQFSGEYEGDFPGIRLVTDNIHYTGYWNMIYRKLFPIGYSNYQIEVSTESESDITTMNLEVFVGDEPPDDSGWSPIIIPPTEMPDKNLDPESVEFRQFNSKEDYHGYNFPDNPDYVDMESSGELESFYENYYDHYKAWYKVPTVTLIGNNLTTDTLISHAPFYNLGDITSEMKINEDGVIHSKTFDAIADVPDEIAALHYDHITKSAITVYWCVGTTAPDDGNTWTQKTDQETQINYWIRWDIDKPERQFYPWTHFTDNDFKVSITREFDNYQNHMLIPFKIPFGIYTSLMYIDGIHDPEKVYDGNGWLVITPSGDSPLTPIAPNGFPYERCDHSPTYDLWLACDQDAIKTIQGYSVPTIEIYDLSYALTLETSKYVYRSEYMIDWVEEKYFHTDMNHFNADIVDVFKDHIKFIPVDVYIGSVVPYDQDNPNKLWLLLDQLFIGFDGNEYTAYVSYDIKDLPVDIPYKIKDWWHSFEKDEYNVFKKVMDIYYKLGVDERRDKKYDLDIYVWPRTSVRELATGLSYTDVQYLMRIKCPVGYPETNFELRIKMDSLEVLSDNAGEKTIYKPESTTDRIVPLDRYYVRKRHKEAFATSYRMPMMSAAAMTYIFSGYLNADGINSTLQYEGAMEKDWDVIFQRLPYPITARWGYRTFDDNAYFDLTRKILGKRRHRAPMGDKRYDFFVNGRLLTLGDQYHIVSPSKIICHGLTSLKNAEILEINREPYKEFFATDNIKNLLDDILDGFIFNGKYETEFNFNEQEEFINKEIWRQVNDDDPLYPYFPCNVDVERDVRNPVDESQSELVDSDGPFDYNGVILDIPTIENATLIKDVYWDDHKERPDYLSIGLDEIPNSQITSDFKRWFKLYLDNPLYMHFDKDGKQMQAASVSTFNTEVWNFNRESLWYEYERDMISELPKYNNPLYEDKEFITLAEKIGINNARWSWKGWWKYQLGLYRQMLNPTSMPVQYSNNEINALYTNNQYIDYWSYAYDNGIFPGYSVDPAYPRILPDGRWYPWYNPGYWDDNVYKPAKPIVWESPIPADIYYCDDTNRAAVKIKWTKPQYIMEKETDGPMAGLITPLIIRVFDETNSTTENHVEVYHEYIDDWNVVEYTIPNVFTDDICYTVRVDAANRAGIRSGWELRLDYTI